MADDERAEHPDLSTFGSGSDSDSEPGPTPDGDAAVDDRSNGGGAAGAGGDTDPGAAADACAGSRTDPASGDADAGAGARPPLAELDRAERVALGVDLLAHLERESVSLPAAVDRIETITTNPALTREILDSADRRGVIDRDGGRLRIRRGGTFVSFETQVVRRAGNYECRRCGAGLGTGHFVRFETGELGPFGPDCVRKVLGRT